MNQNQNLNSNLFLLFTTTIHDLNCFMRESTLVVRLWFSFYLLGPFFLLVERTPADIWLTVCSLSFLIHSIIKRQWFWLSQRWVQALLTFWCFSLVSALLSENVLYSLGEAFGWIRFPLFAFASCFLFSSDKRVFRAFCVATLISLFMMMLIFLAEYIYLGVLPSRFTWPYGDKIPGAFLAKSGLFMFCILVGVATARRGFIAVASGIFSALMLFSTFISGERVSFALLLCSGILVTSIMAKSLKTAVISYFTAAAALVGLFLAIPQLKARYIDQFFGILLAKNSGYREVWNSGIKIIENSPFVGIGPDNYRQLCSQYLVGVPDVWCNNHPHNFALQIIVETGLIGFFLYVTFVFLMIKRAFQSFTVCGEKTVLAVSFVVPLAFFFPLQSNNDFFGQWVNIFNWTALGTALAASYLGELNKDLG